MNYPAFIPLADVDHQLSHELTPFSKRLWSLSQLGLPLAPTFLIPQQALKNVLHKDEAIQAALLKFYHLQCQNEFVTFYYQTEADHQLISIPLIKGDANFLQTLFEVATLHNHQPVVVQSSPQPSHAGLAWTKNQQTQSKNQIEVWAAHGEFSELPEADYDQFIVDHRTGQVVEEHRPPQPRYWKKVPDGLVSESDRRHTQPISKALLTNLAELTILCKRQFFTDYRIRWSVVEGQLVINSIEPVKIDETEITTHQVVTVGTPLLTGYVQGTVFFPSKAAYDATGSILVVEQLNQANWAAVKNASGIIVEKNIGDHQTLKALSHYGIPTLVKAHFATKNLRPGQAIILDAHHGKVYLDQNSSKPAITTNNQPVFYNLTGYPSQLKPSQIHPATGLVITSNHWQAGLKKHPLQLIKEDKNSFYSLVYEELMMANRHFSGRLMYQLCSLDSKARGLLSYGSSLEEPELNPGLGVRGTNYLLKHPVLLDLELTALDFVLTKLDHATPQTRLPLIFPFVRSIEDGLLLNTIVKEKYAHVPVDSWLHLTSLEGLHSTLNYTNWHPVGIVLDLDYLLHSWHGSDPQPVAGKTSTNYTHSSLWPYLTQVLTQSHLPLRVICRHLTHNLLPLVLELKPEVVITTLGYLTAARTR